jgi:putative methionine-R-sulfoxide reductase with GAF domain
MSARALEALERILDGGGEADDVLRAAVAALVEEPGISYAAVAFLEEGELVVGPHGGDANEQRRVCMPVTYQGSQVGELRVDGDADATLLARVAELISAHVLIGWDTGGERWQP